MEAEFVNAFVERQREMINDLVSRNIMLETQLRLSDSKKQTLEKIAEEATLKATSVEEELRERIKSIEQLEKQISQSTEHEKQLRDASAKVEAFRKQNEVLNAELSNIRSKYSVTVVERDDLARRLNDIKSKAAALTEAQQP